jgi:hypothetical protein
MRVRRKPDNICEVEGRYMCDMRKEGQTTSGEQCVLDFCDGDCTDRVESGVERIVSVNVLTGCVQVA